MELLHQTTTQEFVNVISSPCLRPGFVAARASSQTNLALIWYRRWIGSNEDCENRRFWRIVQILTSPLRTFRRNQSAELPVQPRWDNVLKDSIPSAPERDCRW